ncbi:MAG: cyclohydrolase, partial [Gaiellaceae bacterium]|nr:cyclohydrolase [Gaiellaceae bacterium]
MAEPADLPVPERTTSACKYDDEAVRAAVHDLLVAIGENPDRDGLRETPG